MSTLADNFFCVLVPGEHDILFVASEKTEIVTTLTRAIKADHRRHLLVTFANTYVRARVARSIEGRENAQIDLCACMRTWPRVSIELAATDCAYARYRFLYKVDDGTRRQVSFAPSAGMGSICTIDRARVQRHAYLRF